MLPCTSIDGLSNLDLKREQLIKGRIGGAYVPLSDAVSVIQECS